MRFKSLGLLVAGMSLAVLSNGCVSMLAKMALSMATSKTNDLSLCALQTRYVTNLYPKDAHTFEMAYYTSTWTEGAGLVMVSCTARNGSSLYEIEGTVQVDGQPMEYVAGGSYSKILPAGDTKPKTITITTTSGQKTSFTVTPTQPIELVAVNGKKTDSKVDVSEDMTLEFANVGADAGYVRVGLITDTSGMRNFSDIGVYKLGKKIKVPAVAFRHPTLFQTKGGGTLNGKRLASLSTSTQLVTGANYIFVERYEATPIKAEGAAAVENLGLAWSWMPVTVKGSSETIPGVAIAKTMNTSSGGVDYFSTKPASATGKPLARAKKFALVSMSLDGQLEAITDATKYEMGTGATTKNAAGMDEHIYHAWKFPQLPVQHWDSEMERFYGELTAVFQKDFGITFIPTEDVLKAPSYKELTALEEVANAQKISHTFRGLKSFAGPRIGTATVSSDKTEVQLMRELGVDGLVVVNLALTLPTEKVTSEPCNGLVSLPEGGISTSITCRLGEASLQTKATFRIIGMPKAYGPQLTTYAEGELATVKGIGYQRDEFKDAAALGLVVRSHDLVNALKTALREQESKATELGYNDVWATSPQLSASGT
ncbi:hypothetical protein [Oligoflexus tunisiensis]|uniref:hypothetical protein n=1 Tax=Oligoflexus tunisiensis TaxID=708132 RepID=UPI001FDF767F|nr:hypothetical protein [Oligoflexus tunisiensis]